MDSATKILDIAERRMRQTGYNAVSYRDIAEEMGIKSASLHYHFSKKEELGSALMRRYSNNFADALSEILSDGKGPKQNIEAFVAIYRHELTQRKLVCLGAVLGAETAGLPGRVSEEVNHFFARNIDWLKAQYENLGVDNPLGAAKTTLSLLTGAMTISAANNDNSIFDAAVDTIQQLAV